MTSSAPHRYYRCNHRSKVILFQCLHMHVVLCTVDDGTSLLSDNHKDLVRSTKYHIEIENINARELQRRRSALQPHSTTPPGLRTSTPYKNQTALVVGSWSHDRRNTRTEQTKLAGSMWRARKRIIHLLARPKQNFDHGQTKKCAKRLSSIPLKSRKQQ